jgi:glycosyltransferase involved in cell wall biosynthesis
MKIGLDVRYISHGLTGGVRTYVYHLAQELPQAASQHQFVYYADDKSPLELENLPANVTLRTLKWNGTVSSIRNDSLIGRLMDADRVDVAHSPGNYGPRVSCPLVITLHDTLNLFPMSEHLRGFSRRPKQVGMMLYLGRMTRLSLRRAARVITVSEHARRDIAARSGFPLDRLIVTHEAAGEAFVRIADQRRLDEIRHKYRLPARFVLADGIKNPAAVVDAFSQLSQEVRAGTELIFFSRESTPRAPVAAVLGRLPVRFIPQPPTADLVGLMNLAAVFAFPSWYEGFGIPIVEAMQCGTPVIGSSRGSIPEVVGDGGLIFDLEAPDQFRRHLQRVLCDEAFRNQLAQRALSRARSFSWQQTARQTLAVYEDAVALRRQTA